MAFLKRWIFVLVPLFFLARTFLGLLEREWFTVELRIASQDGRPVEGLELEFVGRTEDRDYHRPLTIVEREGDVVRAEFRSQYFAPRESEWFRHEPPRVIAKTTSHGAKSVALDRSFEAEVAFGSPGWVTVQIDPPLDPADLERWELEWRSPGDPKTLTHRTVDVATIVDGDRLRLGPVAPGDVEFVLEKRPKPPPPSAPGEFRGSYSRRIHYVTPSAIRTGENEITIRRR